VINLFISTGSCRVSNLGKCDREFVCPHGHICDAT